MSKFHCSMFDFERVRTSATDAATLKTVRTASPSVRGPSIETRTTSASCATKTATSPAAPDLETWRDPEGANPAPCRCTPRTARMCRNASRLRADARRDTSGCLPMENKWVCPSVDLIGWIHVRFVPQKSSDRFETLEGISIEHSAFVCLAFVNRHEATVV